MERVEEYRNVDFAGLLVLAADGAMLCGEIDGSTRRGLEEALGDRVRVATPAAGLRRAAFIAERGWRYLRAGAPGEPALVDAIYLAR